MFLQNRRYWVRLHERGQGACHALPSQPRGVSAGLYRWCGLKDDPQGPLLRTIGCDTKSLTGHPSPRLMLGRWSAGGRLRLVSQRRSAITRSVHRDHGLSEEWGCSRKGSADGQPCQHTHHAALRPRGTTLRLMRSSGPDLSCLSEVVAP